MSADSLLEEFVKLDIILDKFSKKLVYLSKLTSLFGQ